MRQFILAKQFVRYFNLAEASVGDLGFEYTGNHTTDNPSVPKHANLVLKTENGHILFPIYPKNLTGSIMKYKEGISFIASFTIGEVNPYLNYTVTFVKKGKQFNERNKWTSVIHSKATDTPETIAEAIVKFVLDNPLLGLIARNEGAKVMIACPNGYEDYTVSFGDELYGTQLDQVTQAEPVQGDAAHIKDLFEKCAADRGFNYTAEDLELYPGYKVNIEEAEYSIMTLRFTEPRVMGTREEEVYQIIQVAMPNDEGQMNLLVDEINRFFYTDIFLIG